MIDLLNELKKENYSILNIMEKLVDFMCIKDGQGKWVKVNILGNNHKLAKLRNLDVLGKKDEELEKDYPDYKWFFENSHQSDEQTWSNSSISKFEERIQDNDGKWNVFEVVKIPFFQEDGTRKELVVLGKDITFHKSNEMILEVKDKELQDIKYALDESAIVAITEPSGMITYVNKKLTEISKYRQDELVGKTHRVLNSGYHPKSFFREMWQTIQSGQVWRGNIKNKAKDGSYYWVSTTIVPFLNKEGKPYQYIAIRHEITEQIKNQERIQHQSYHDQLTGLRNRWYLYEELNSWVIENKEKRRMAILIVDINRFKTINDKLGHTIGDQILKGVANRFQIHKPENVDLYRFSGDVFIFAIKDCSIDEIEELTDLIHHLLINPFPTDGESLYLTASIGVSIYPDDGKDIESLVRKADSAMFVAKNKHIQGAQFYSSEKYNEIRKRATMENELRKAVEHKDFHLLYQPQIDLRTNEMVGVEALIRWENEELGFISPGEFIPIAEEIGVIGQLTEWVLETACLKGKEWQQQGIPPLRIGVNISPYMIGEELVLMVEKTLEKTGLEAKYVDLEITESFMQDPDYAIHILKKLKEIGVRLSIDDFGTGYSSLSNLRKLPVDCLKIDRSFIQEMLEDEGVIVKTILDMANHLKLSVVAEGIETEDQLQFLNTLHCQVGQGYYFSRPVAEVPVTSRFLSKG
ncbi:sensor domain-containing protein [Ornithinibacillus halophilus]|uniref:PAS domain S-box-containing protein/diguanylate cyclase (GGDEF) domain-containing protein n=1 Tax=Ornithinibacillus halophilus TaxID=930117 RepID=A0A1M5FX34_9BACI|nr:GGDEF domain-containing phosphodiesterase [Ornithinibacillus halophilus]SHF95751.1 PAS domain S-box-containing protein/diguanylate cyclase (GGDEF) domain-containing protein [Ornithinibacillus halophilus]